jgi:multicomponent K+:H+ antiporter subunit G
MMTELPAWVAIPVSILLVISGFLTLTGSLGLLRLKSFYTRIHAPTLGNTLGVFCVLVASVLVSSTLEQRVVVHQFLITVFLVITSPVTATLLMRAAIKRNVDPSVQQPKDVDVAASSAESRGAGRTPGERPREDAGSAAR